MLGLGGHVRESTVTKVRCRLWECKLVGGDGFLVMRSEGRPMASTDEPPATKLKAKAKVKGAAGADKDSSESEEDWLAPSSGAKARPSPGKPVRKKARGTPTWKLALGPQPGGGLGGVPL